MLGAYMAEALPAEVYVDIAQPPVIEEGTALVLREYEGAVFYVTAEPFSEFSACRGISCSSLLVYVYFPALAAAVPAVTCDAAEIPAVSGGTVYHILPP
jgi:hypothetical protein